MFNRAEIMKKAWAKYREFRKFYASWQIERGIVDASFSNCLSIAWRIAKSEASAAAAQAKALADYGDRAAERVRELTNELMRIDSRPFGLRSHRVADDRAALIAQIAVLSVRN
jgi:enoyl-[acyl-carrier-protein] reductase (NADH)